MFRELEALLRRDPGGRGVEAFAVEGQLEPAARALAGAERAVICSGFPVRGPDGWVAETDGPPGALALGRALSAIGVGCRYATGPRSAPLFAGLGCAPLDALDLRAGDAEGARTYLRREAVTHLIAVERPGRSRDGSYRTMRGEVLPDVAALDELFLVAGELGVVTVGIGDGGNEVGLGGARAAVEGAVPHGAEIASRVATDFPLVAGISTWGAWTLVAALAVVTGRRDLLVEPAQARADLEQVVALGGVDGVTGRSSVTLDGVGWSDSEAFLVALGAVGRGIG